VQLYVVSGNGERRLLRELGEGACIEPNMGVLDRSARGAHKMSVAVDGAVIAQRLPLTEAQLGHLPSLHEQREHPIDRRRSDALNPFAYAVKDLARRRVVLRLRNHLEYRPTLRSQPEYRRAHAPAAISSHHWQYQSCPTRMRSFGCQQ
jgi:hypothetical protein